MHHGKVWLVGAGPGDEGLFTLKGKTVLDQADVVVYDSLIGDGILAMIPPTATAIHVGKRANAHTMPQADINALLLHEAQQGKRVVRLKGGDPFLFGRGGEELELLAAAHIPFEVVPGVTSSIAVPAYNGIPVTHRDFCSSVHIITGHKKAGQAEDIPFQALADTKGTLVFLMGAAALVSICDGLQAAGMAPTTPAAFLQRGTTAGQQRIVATLATLPAATAAHGIVTPAIIVVGAVCALAEDFAWFEQLPLFGKTFLITRPKEQIDSLASKLRALGAQVLALPTIAPTPLTENPPLTAALEHLAAYGWILYTSPTAVTVFFDALKAHGKDIRALAACRIAAIGGMTAKKLNDYGIFADFVGNTGYGADCARALAAAIAPTQDAAPIGVLLPRAQGGNPAVAEILTAHGLHVTDLPTYETRPVQTPHLDLAGKLKRQEITAAVFTSASTVEGFVRATTGVDYTALTALCIGEKTAAAARAHGMQCKVSKQTTIDSLLDCAKECPTWN